MSGVFTAELARVFALAIGMLGGLWLGVFGLLVLCDNTPRSTIGHLRTLAGGMLALFVGVWLVAFVLGAAGDRL